MVGPPLPFPSYKGDYPNVTRAEQRELWLRMRQGDRAARERLFMSVVPWIFHCCQKFTRNATTEDEFQQVCMRCWESLELFDPDKGALTTFFQPHAYWVIARMRYCQRTCIRIPAGKTLSKQLANCAKVQVHNDLHAFTEMLAAPPPEDGADVFLLQKVHAAAQRLRPRDWEILQLRLAGETLSQIGKRYGVGKERIRQCEARAIRQLREFLHVPQDEAA